jgi:thiamine-monophosphate kinase
VVQSTLYFKNLGQPSENWPLLDWAGLRYGMSRLQDDMSISHNENAVLRKIEKFFPGHASGVLLCGIGDDAAVIKPRPGHEIILTCDWFLEGSHFLREQHSAEAVGWKCLARALSDVAAMGGAPRCFLLSLAVPTRATGIWLSGLLRGLRRASQSLGCALAGGDTTRREDILISITVIGEVRAGRAILRSGACAGDLLYVTGTLGEAELGLRLLRGGRGIAEAKNAFLKKHLHPEPRLAVGQWLAKNRLTSAMMDLSDGLSTDLARLCEASGVGARIWPERLPISYRVGRANGLSLALHGGDDYELLFAVNPAKSKRIPREYRGVPLTCIGEVLAGTKVFVEEGGQRRKLTAAGWDPFRQRERKRDRS